MYTFSPKEARVESVIPGFTLGKLSEETALSKGASKSPLGQAIINAIPVIRVTPIEIENAERIVNAQTGKLMIRINVGKGNQTELRPKTPEETAKETADDLKAQREAEQSGKPKKKKSIHGKLMHSEIDAKMYAIMEMKLIEEQIAEAVDLLSKADQTVRGTRKIYEEDIEKHKEDESRTYVIVSASQKQKDGQKGQNQEQENKDNK